MILFLVHHHSWKKRACRFWHGIHDQIYTGECSYFISKCGSYWYYTVTCSLRIFLLSNEIIWFLTRVCVNSVESWFALARTIVRCAKKNQRWDWEEQREKKETNWQVWKTLIKFVGRQRVQHILPLYFSISFELRNHWYTLEFWMSLFFITAMLAPRGKSEWTVCRFNEKT